MKQFCAPLAILVLSIVGFGVFMITSLSAPQSHSLLVGIHGERICEEQEGGECVSDGELTAGQKIRNYGEAYCQEQSDKCNGFYLFRHLRNVALGLLALLFGFLVPMPVWRKMALPIFGVSVLLLIIVLFLPTVGGQTARSWINVPVLPSIQPSEIAKLGLIVYLAMWMDKKEKEVRTWHGGFVPFVILMLPIVFLIALQPDFGSLLVIACIAAMMFFVAGGNLLHITAGGLGTIAIALPIILSHEYIRNRVMVFLGVIDSSAVADAGFQTKQALIAIGTGGIWGMGIGESRARHGWVPEISSDMVFTGTAEELGFIRIVLFMALFGAVIWIGSRVAQYAVSRFESLVVTGIITWIGMQSIIHMAVNVGIFPNTGITLPFLSHGGSSLLTLMLAVGIMLRIAKITEKHESYLRRRR